MNSVVIRSASPADVPVVAELRWRWLAENRDVPVVSHDHFIRAFVGWASEHPTHECAVAVRGDAVIGMAWLATVARVPSPTKLARASGDLQSVYLVPDERGGGIGSRLLQFVLDLADERGLDHVTVHSSEAATSLYRRAGFGEEGTYLRRVRPR